MVEKSRAAAPTQPIVTLAEQLGVTSQALLGSSVAMEAIRSRLPEVLAAMVSNRNPLTATDDQASSLPSSPIGRARATLDMITVIKGLQDLTADGALPHDPLNFVPDWKEAGVNSLLKAARSRPRAETVSPAYLASWLACSARWVIEYAPRVLAAYHLLRNDPGLCGSRRSASSDTRLPTETVRINAEAPAGMPHVILSWERQQFGPQAKHSLTVCGLILQLHAACMITVAAFAALSLDDFTALKVGCIVDNGEGGPLLTATCDAAFHDLAGVPVNELVVRAINVLIELTADARVELGSDTMDRVLRWGSARREKGRFMRLPAPSSLRSFGLQNGLPLVDAATGVGMSGDHLRKGYVVAMAYVLPGASSEDVCKLARLSDPAAAREYVLRGVAGRSDALRADIEADKVRGIAHAGADAAWLAERRDLLKRLIARDRMFGQVLKDERVRMLWRIQARIEVPGGRGGQALVATLEKALRESVPSTTANHPDADRAVVDGVIRRVADHVWYEAVPGGHAHCTCRPGSADLEEARCLTARADASRPWDSIEDEAPAHADLAWSGLSRCLGSGRDDRGRGGCPFAMTNAEDRAALACTLQQARAALAGAPTAATIAAAELLLEGIEIAVANGRPPTLPS